MSAPLLPWLILLPLGAALIAAVTPAARMAAARGLTWAVLLVQCVLSLQLLSGDYARAGYRFVERGELGGVRYALGVDGLSLWLVIAVVWSAPLLLLLHRQASRAALVAVGWLQGALVGALCAFDLLLFFLFFEMALIPPLIVARSRGALRRVFFEWSTGLALLAGIALLAVQYREQTGRLSFDLVELGQLLLPVETQRWYFLLFSLPLLARLPLPPLHAPSADAAAEQAPLSGALSLLASAPLGLYGLMRVSMTLFPAGAHRAGVTLAAIGVVGILYGALAALRRRDAGGVLAYVVLAQAGLSLLGLFSVTSMGVMGALLMVVVVSLAGVIAWSAPSALSALVIVGLPPFAGFVAQLLIFGGVLRAEHLGANGTPLSVVAALGISLVGVRALWLSRGQALRLGPRAAPVGLGALLALGLLSGPVVERMEPAADHFARVYTAKLKTSDGHPERRGLLERVGVGDE